MSSQHPTLFDYNLAAHVTHYCTLALKTTSVGLGAPVVLLLPPLLTLPLLPILSLRVSPAGLSMSAVVAPLPVSLKSSLLPLTAPLLLNSHAPLLLHYCSTMYSVLVTLLMSLGSLNLQLSVLLTTTSLL